MTDKEIVKMLDDAGMDLLTDKDIVKKHDCFMRTDNMLYFLGIINDRMIPYTHPAIGRSVENWLGPNNGTWIVARFRKQTRLPIGSVFSKPLPLP